MKKLIALLLAVMLLVPAFFFWKRYKDCAEKCKREPEGAQSERIREWGAV